jgi:hypothetical protein
MVPQLTTSVSPNPDGYGLLSSGVDSDIEDLKRKFVCAATFVRIRVTGGGFQERTAERLRGRDTVDGRTCAVTVPICHDNEACLHNK